MATPITLTYEQAVEAYNFIYGNNAPTVEQIMNEYGLTQEEFVAAAVNDQFINNSSIGDAKGRMIYNSNGQAMYQAGEFYNVSNSGINSNTTTKTTMRAPVSTSWAPREAPATGRKIVSKVGLREAGNFFLGTVAPPVLAAGIGISLGKTIDSTLYNLNPDFWDEHGMSSLNPETWASLTSEDDSGLGSLFNLVFGLDGDKTQAYIDEDSYAYLAMWLAQQGVFAAGSEVEYGTITRSETLDIGEEAVTGTLESLKSIYAPTVPVADTYYWEQRKGYNAVLTGGNEYGRVCFCCGNGLTVGSGTVTISSDPSGSGVASVTPNLTVNAGSDSRILQQNDLGQMVFGSSNPPLVNDSVTSRLGFSTILVKSKLTGGIDGIGDQPGATLPNTDGWTDPDATKQSLQQQYPDQWNNAKHYDYVDSDGNQKSKTMIPVNLPNTSHPKDKQPTSGTETQQKTDIDPDTSTETLIDLITQIIRGNPTPGKTDTGTGDSPTVTTPTGSASSLWAVYNPTQAQVDSFGAWLWSSNLVEQIKKLFNNPMEAIIGIHKIYATPSTGAAVNIKCGYIDSGVPAAAVTDQYTTINCGTVNLSEYFGNIFDYAPYTKVDMFLPFIGVVSLDVGDVMRASINVKYTVDVFTGSCLAEVKINRDSAKQVLYTYSGCCAVTYPLSSGTYASALAGILSIAGGVVGTIASGGALAPALIGGAVGATALHSDVQKSGGFSGPAGAMGGKKPYLIISRPQTAMPGDILDYKGLPTSRTVTIGSCSGFVKVDSCHLTGVTATSEELTEIENLLKTGVIV